MLEQIANFPAWQIYAIVFYLLLQSAVFSPFPEEVILTTMGLLCSRGQVEFIPAVLVCQAGILSANAVTVTLGSVVGSKFLHRRPLRWVFKKDSVESSLAKLREQGLWLVFATRFTPLVRGPFYFAVGLSKMPLRRFSKVDALASCIQVPVLLFLGQKIGKNSTSLLAAYGKVGLFMGLLLVGGFLLQSRRQRARKQG